MKRVTLLAIAVSVLAAWSVAGPNGRAQAATPPGFEPAPCEDLVTYVPDGYDVARLRCGYVPVPEDRTKPGGRVLRLAVAVVPANESFGDAKPDPLLFLTGGPGQGAVDGALFFGRRDISGDIQQTRDIVFYDQRGTGYSGALTCEPSPDEGLSLAVLTACADRYQDEGIDLGQYTSAQSARDTVDVMQSLGYEEWNLVGVSYGTRLALTIMRDEPEHVRSVILDSVLPIEVNPELDNAAKFQGALEVVFAECAKHAACHAAYPDLENVYWDLVMRANASPIPVTIEGPDGAPLELEIDGNSIIEGTHAAFYDQTLIPLLPLAIYDIAAGNTGILTLLAQQLTQSFGLAEVMRFSVGCNEEYPFFTNARLEAAHVGVRQEIIDSGLGGFTTPESLAEWLAFCRTLEPTRPPSRENLPVSSDIPTLVFAGQLDHVTPPVWAQLVADALTTSHYVELPRTVHAVTFWRPECTGPMMAAFLDAPATAPDASCLAETPQLEFNVLDAAPQPQSPDAPAPIVPISPPDTGSSGDAASTAAFTVNSEGTVNSFRVRLGLMLVALTIAAATGTRWWGRK